MPTRRGSVITAIMERTHPATPIATNEIKVPFYQRLRVKLLLLICLSVLLTEALVFIPSLANRQHRWFENEHRFAYALAVSIFQDETLSQNRGLAERSLTNLELLDVAIIAPDGHQTRITTDQPELVVDKIVDLDRFNDFNFIVSSIRTLLFGGNRVMQVVGHIGNDGTVLSILTRDFSLRMALFQFTERFFFSSLAIGLIVAIIIYLLVTEILLRPVTRIYSNVLDFVMAPDDPKSILVPENRHDEIGLVQQRLAAIETQLQRSYAQQRKLADLGLAISKINHDMRNMLTSAQLVSDRLGSIDDPLIKRLAPKLIRAINRAINYTHSVLAYGRIQEHPPHYQRLALKNLVDDVIDMLEPGQYDDVTIDNKVAADFEIDADGEHLHRVLTNLCRNALQALTTDKGAGQCPLKQVTICAHNDKDMVVIDINDTGPGMPALAREHIFKPFQGSARHDGTGLGLAICHELVRAHCGTIMLVNAEKAGTHFQIRIPARQTQNLSSASDSVSLGQN